MHKVAISALGVTCALSGGVFPSVPASAADEELIIHVSADAPAASDGQAKMRIGSSPEAPVSSIAEAEEIARSKGALRAKILLRGGMYYPTSPIRWTYAPPGGHITFAPEPGTGDVIIDGRRLRVSRADLGYTAQAKTISTEADARALEAASADYGLTVDAGDSGITIRGMTFQYHRNGGIRVAGAPGNRTNNIVIYGNVIQHIGSKHKTTGTGTGYGGIHITNSTGTRIEGNRFYYLENTDSPAAIHGVYAANYTNSTVIYGNRFGYISGDPIRTRHNSKYNVVEGNMFWKAGAYATFSDWRFGDEDCGVGNVFQANKVGDTTYNNDRWNEDGQGGIDPVRVRLHGHDNATNANLGGCGSNPISFGSGGNSYVSSRPW